MNEIHIIVQNAQVGEGANSNIVIWQTHIALGGMADNPDYVLGGTYRRGGERYFVWSRKLLTLTPDATSMNMLVKNEWERRHEYRIWVTTE